MGQLQLFLDFLGFLELLAFLAFLAFPEFQLVHLVLADNIHRKILHHRR